MYAGPQILFGGESAELRFGTRGAAAFSGLGGLVEDIAAAIGPRPTLPEAKEAGELTPAEFLDRIHKVAWGLAYLARYIPDHERRFLAFQEEEGEAYAMVTVQLGVARGLCEVMSAQTSQIFGPAWETVLAAAPAPTIGTQRTAAIAQAMSTAGADKVHEWLGLAAQTIKAGFDAIQAEIDVRYAEAESDLAFWGGLYDMTVGLWNLRVGGLKALIIGLIRAIGDLGGAAAESLAAALWKIVKPLLIPAGVIVGGYVAYRYAWPRIVAYHSSKRLPSAQLNKHKLELQPG